MLLHELSLAFANWLAIREPEPALLATLLASPLSGASLWEIL